MLIEDEKMENDEFIYNDKKKWRRMDETLRHVEEERRRRTDLLYSHSSYVSIILHL